MIRLALAGVSIVGMAKALYEVAEEVYEQIATDNEVIDLDYWLMSIVFKNNEKRTQEELFAQIEKAIFNVDNIDKAFDDSIELNKEEKMKIVQDIITAVQNEANLSTCTFKLEDMDGIDGYYFSIYNQAFSIVTKKIAINENMLNDRNFQDTIYTVIHEMMHAVESENILRSDQVTAFDKKVFFKKREFKDYYTSFNELNTQIRSQDIFLNLQNEYGDSTYIAEERATLKLVMFQELILNLYGVNTFENSNFGSMPQEYKDFYVKDENNYRYLTIKELILLGFEKKLDNAKINHDEIDLTQTYYYKSFARGVGEEWLDVTFIDYYYSPFSPNLTNNVLYDDELQA
ncbi:MAG: hypothetical protein PHC46_02935 [Clostridia bacterium]|nr:hypothetical protein [Clostridia bacterium]